MGKYIINNGILQHILVYNLTRKKKKYNRNNIYPVYTVALGDKKQCILLELVCEMGKPIRQRISLKILLMFLKVIAMPDANVL